MDELFEQVRRHVADLEKRYGDLVAESRRMDEQLVELSGEATPVVWISGPLRADAKKLLVSTSSDEDGIHPFRLDTKYYVADVLLNTSTENHLDDRNHAVIIAMGGEFDEDLATRGFDALGEVRICICDDARAVDWCVEQGVEYVSWDEAQERIKESLEATMWPNLVMKEKREAASAKQGITNSSPQTVSVPTTVPGSNQSKDQSSQRSGSSAPKRKELDQDDELELLEKMMAQARHLRDTAATKSDTERRQRAAEAAEQLIKLLGLEDESDEEFE